MRRTRWASRSRRPPTGPRWSIWTCAARGGKVLVVVVAAGGHVVHKVVETQRGLQHAELQQAANYLNAEFKGRSLDQVRMRRG